MKRVSLLIALALFVTTGIAQAQSKVDAEGFKKKIAKFETDSKDAKKGAKASLWLDGAKTYYEAATAPTNGMYKGLDIKMSEVLFGKPKVSDVTIGKTKYKKNEYADFSAYFTNNQAAFWEPKLVIVEDGLNKSAAAYLKAYEIDKGTAGKVNDGLKKISDAYKQEADNYYGMQKYSDAAAAFGNAYKVQKESPTSVIDTLSIFNSGFLYTVGGNFAKGKEALVEAIAAGHDADGESQYYLFHCYFGLKDNANAKKILEEGIAKYPNNPNIIEGLIGLYATTGDDPKTIIPYVEAAIKKDPKNANLYAGLGNIYSKLGDLDKAIESFKTAINMEPKNFNLQYNLGVLYIQKGDALNSKLSSNPTTSQADYNANLAKVITEYRNSLAPLEAAHAINPKDANVVEVLKTVCFRLRDEEGIMDKYNKYNELFKSMQQ